jgi:uncharacterized membrane protein YgaE (UPF0421/DUF939 family)
MIGLVGSTICLMVFGKDHFIIPAMITILVALTLHRKDPVHNKKAA